MTARQNPPAHMPRPMRRGWTPRERIGIAQSCSLHSRITAVTLPEPPWQQDDTGARQGNEPDRT